MRDDQGKIAELEKQIQRLETPAKELMEEESVGDVDNDESWWNWFNGFFRRMLSKTPDCHDISNEQQCVNDPRCIWQEEFWPHGCESNSEFVAQLKHVRKKDPHNAVDPENGKRPPISS